MDYCNTDLYTLPDGGLYFGHLSQSGLPEGSNGTCIWKSRKMKYIGNWLDGKMHGVGTMYYADGKQVYGVWYEGELIYEFKHHKQDHTETSEPDNTTSPVNNNQPVNNQPPVNNKKIVALLIGNNNYKSGNNLSNCINDVRAIGQKLESIGIEVLKLENPPKSDVEDVIVRLCNDRSKDYDHVLFFYSGHGVSNQGRHYLIAIDENDSQTLPVSIETLDAVFSNHFENVILISDACASIFSGDWNDQPVKGGINTLINISTSLGNYASDGIPGEHSPFAFGLLEYLDKKMPMLDIIEEANKLACAYAYKILGQEQIPTLLKAPFYPKDFTLF